MLANFLLCIDNPDSHYLQVRLSLSDVDSEQTQLFLPSWSPGSYLMREYSRHVRKLTITNLKGEHLTWSQIEKGTWEIDTKEQKDVIVSYEIYCHELTVRTSHITIEHAFLHGPSIYMGVKGEELNNISVELRFPDLWEKISTGLEEVSEHRNQFKYLAKNYDDLLDCPIEIGCHHTDGFMINGIAHEIAIWGKHDLDLAKVKNDIKVILETVLKTMKEIPYTRYLIIAHLKPNLYGGLEHGNSTVLQFCSLTINQKERYQDWLTLVAHEYFHTWNVKRIRPIELGPFNYTSENYTRMHWLTEGLTSFMDELLTLRSGLISLEDYLRMQKKNLERYFLVQGKYFDSLEDSSFNAWIKLYRPDENSVNSTISYYLKGGIAFWILSSRLVAMGKNIDDLMDLLWSRYKQDPACGITKDEVYKMIGEIAGEDLLQQFTMMIETIDDLPVLQAFQDCGLNLVFDESKIYFGWMLSNQSGMTIVKTVFQDGTASKNKISAGDEIIAVNGKRVPFSYCDQISSYLKENQKYVFTIARQGELKEIEVTPSKTAGLLKSIEIVDEAKAKRSFL